MALDLYDYKTFTVTPNAFSHMHTDCDECRTGIARPHIYSRDLKATVVHTVSSKRRNFYHATTVFENGWVTCTCEHGNYQAARNQPAHCADHLSQAEEQIAALFEAEYVTDYELFEEPLLESPTSSDGAPFFPVDLVPVRISSVTGQPIRDLAAIFEGGDEA